MKEIVLAGGCFWGVQAYFDLIEGVEESTVGYANGSTENPSYEEVCTGKTGHSEAVYIKYDEKKVSLETILNKFWNIIDPTILNRQGPDIGNQYRTGIYFINKEDLKIIYKTKEEISQKYTNPIVTEIEELKCFYNAEEYHQKYLEKNPGGYCHIDLS